VARLRIVFRLGLKELWAVLRDPVLLGLVAYTFTIAIVTVARGVRTEVRDAAIAVVDLDGSPLSVRLAQAFLPPGSSPPGRSASKRWSGSWSAARRPSSS
jgi:ABC-2 type transport system permease protein